jgi:hypothetical protein
MATEHGSIEGYLKAKCPEESEKYRNLAVWTPAGNNRLWRNTLRSAGINRFAAVEQHWSLENDPDVGRRLFERRPSGDDFAARRLRPPALKRSGVLFPQPDGPRIETNSLPLAPLSSACTSAPPHRRGWRRW